MAYIDRMKAQDYIDKTREYLDYLEEHISNVRQAFTELTDACKSLPIVVDDYSWHTLREQVVWHDVSKLTKEEFIQYRDNFFPVSDTDKENSGFDDAWENHKKANNHHHETARDFLDIFHMVVDWTAMGYKFGDTAQQYYENNKDRIKLTKEQIDFMYQIFDCIRKNKENM